MARKVLIIDDEEDMRIYLQTLFRKAGYETATAINGEEALEQMNRQQPDFVTLDILMPKKSGLNFYRALRSGEKHKNLPVVVLSGISGHREFFDETADSGPSIFIEKPIEPESFLKKVAEFLGE
jgi:CheY-like chemotaxis protein